MLDSVSSRPCGITPAMLEEVASPKEFVTLSLRLTSKNSFVPRNYPHTPEQISKELRVDNEGNLWWKRPKQGRMTYKSVGTINGSGYKITSLDRHFYLNSTLAFCLYYGRWPSPGKVIDHVNHNTLDDRKENLREASQAENARNRKGLPSNNTSGVIGVHWSKRYDKWFVQLKFNNKTICGGSHESFEDAVAARRQLEIDYGVADYAVVTSCTSPKPKTLDSMSAFQNISL